MKMREKTKLKTIEEIPLEELESQVLVEGQFIIDWSHFECSKLYRSYHMLKMFHMICYF